MNLDQVVRIAKALSDPARLKIYAQIAGHPETICGEVVDKSGLTPGTVSHHLKILSDAKLIECRREGQFIHNKAVGGTMRDYIKTLNALSKSTKNGRAA